MNKNYFPYFKLFFVFITIICLIVIISYNTKNTQSEIVVVVEYDDIVIEKEEEKIVYHEPIVKRERIKIMLPEEKYKLRFSANTNLYFNNMNKFRRNGFR